MNLKISENSFRFRITPDDLEKLMQGRDLDQRVRIGHHGFSYRISSAEPDFEMSLEMAVSGFCLYVPRGRLDELQSMGRSKSGISFLQDGVEISLQVDIKMQKMQRAA